MSSTNEEILARLESIDRKLDYVVERQRWTEELIEEMTPIGREMMSSASNHLMEWEAQGAFAMLGELRRAIGHVLTSYSPEDARQLADSLVSILGTVRNLTQDDILAVANDATNVLHTAGDVQPVGMFGAMRKASNDEEVKRGMAVTLEVLRRLGRARGGGEPVSLELPATTRERTATPAVSQPKKAAPAVAEAIEAVEWEGHYFDPNGFLIDPSTWSPELAEKIAAGLGITLTDEHHLVLEWVRADYASTGASPNVRRVATGSGLGTQAMYRLFPSTPGKTCAMIAGVPKPVGCV